MKPRGSTETIVIHHSASGATTTIDQIREWHKDRGWEDIGYHWIIDYNGVIHPGRPESMEGTQVANYNHKSIGICLCGDFRWLVPSVDQKQALIDLCAKLVKKYELKYWNIYGHKDIKKFFVLKTTATECPGNNLYNLLPRVRSAVGLLVGQLAFDVNKTITDYTDETLKRG